MSTGNPPRFSPRASSMTKANTNAVPVATTRAWSGSRITLSNKRPKVSPPSRATDVNGWTQNTVVGLFTVARAMAKRCWTSSRTMVLLLLLLLISGFMRHDISVMVGEELIGGDYLVVRRERGGGFVPR